MVSLTKHFFSLNLSLSAPFPFDLLLNRQDTKQNVERYLHMIPMYSVHYNTKVFTSFFPYIQHLKCLTNTGPFPPPFYPSNTFFFKQASSNTAGLVITNLPVFEEWKKLKCKQSVSEENSLSIQGGEDNETSSALLIGVLSHCLFTRCWADSVCGNWFLNFRCLSWTAFQYINIDEPVLGSCAQSSVL